MGLLQKDVQRVKTGVLPLHAGAQVAPREQLAFVKCIPEGPHLRKHRVQPKARTIVQHLCAPGAEGVCRGIGIGINLNQAVFRGDAPNPVSLFQIIGKEVDREEVLDRFLSVFYRYYLSLLQEEYEDIRIRYQFALYRREGYHAYRDEAGEFEACIHDIESTGHLLLALRDGSIRRYAFKEVSYCK